MANVLTYPIYFPYGAKLFPFYGSVADGDGFNGTIAPAHHGDDRTGATGGEVIVSGKQIGLSGATGTVTGPHLHNDKYKQGKYTGVYVAAFNRTYFKPTDAFGITGTVIFAGDAGTAGKMVEIQATNGYNYRFLHLSRIDVGVGDIIKADDMTSRTTAIWLLRTLQHVHSPTEARIKSWTGLDDAQLSAKLEGVYGADWFKGQTEKITAPTEYEPFTPPELYIRKI